MVFETSTGHRPAAVLAMGVRSVDQGDLRQQAHRGRPPSIRAFCVRRDLSAPVDDRPGTRAWLCHRRGRRRDRRVPARPLAPAPPPLPALFGGPPPPTPQLPPPPPLPPAFLPSA